MSQDLVVAGTEAASMLAEPSQRSGLSGRRRAAALLVALGPDRAANVLKHLTGHRADEISRYLRPVLLGQEGANITHARPAGVHRNDPVIKAGKPTLVFGDQNRL